MNFGMGMNQTTHCFSVCSHSGFLSPRFAEICGEEIRAFEDCAHSRIVSSIPELYALDSNRVSFPNSVMTTKIPPDVALPWTESP